MYAFYLYADEDNEIVPSDVMEVNIKEENLIKTLDKDLVTAVVYNPDEQIWFYCKDFKVLISYLQGMYFAVSELVDKDWKNHFTEQ